MQNQDYFSHWVEQSLPSGVDTPRELRLQALAGDAGFRRYFRVNTEPSLIAVNSPPEKEKNSEYVKLSLFLKAQGIKTPKIHAVNYADGYMLVEDFGFTLFGQKLETDNPNLLYDRAEKELLKIQKTTDKTTSVPLHNEIKMSQELALFEQWFLNDLLGYQLSSDEKTMLDQFFKCLISSSKSQPQVLIHADYHSRNLMILEQEQLGVIDFQDAMLGGITYDLVSLLKDCYVRRPENWVIERALKYKQHLVKANLLNHVDDKKFLQWFDLMGLQRHIKVLGIFSRLALRDAKNSYLNDIPLVVHYCLEASDKYPQAKQFNQWFRDKILPLLDPKTWFSNVLEDQ